MDITKMTFNEITKLMKTDRYGIMREMHAFAEANPDLWIYFDEPTRMSISRTDNELHGTISLILYGDTNGTRWYLMDGAKGLGNYMLGYYADNIFTRRLTELNHNKNSTTFGQLVDLIRERTRYDKWWKESLINKLEGRVCFLHALSLAKERYEQVEMPDCEQIMCELYDVSQLWTDANDRKAHTVNLEYIIPTTQSLLRDMGWREIDDYEQTLQILKRHKKWFAQNPDKYTILGNAGCGTKTHFYTNRQGPRAEFYIERLIKEEWSDTNITLYVATSDFIIK